MLILLLVFSVIILLCVGLHVCFCCKCCCFKKKKKKGMDGAETQQNLVTEGA